VTEAIKGRRVSEALAILQFLPNMPARDVYKVVASAAANAENNYEADPDALWVTNAIVDEGESVSRWRIRPHGRSSRIKRRSSHITVYVSDNPEDLPAKARRHR
jgi:large subunit ribosomal protein L22